MNFNYLRDTSKWKYELRKHCNLSDKELLKRFEKDLSIKIVATYVGDESDVVNHFVDVLENKRDEIERYMKRPRTSFKLKLYADNPIRAKGYIRKDDGTVIGPIKEEFNKTCIICFRGLDDKLKFSTAYPCMERETQQRLLS